VHGRDGTQIPNRWLGRAFRERSTRLADLA